jgi:hypothetical protein
MNEQNRHTGDSCCAKFDEAIAQRDALTARAEALEKERDSEIEQSRKKDLENTWLRNLGAKREEIVSSMKSEALNAYHLEDAWHSLSEVVKLCGKYFNEKGDFKEVPVTNNRMTEKLIRDNGSLKSSLSDLALRFTNMEAALRLAQGKVEALQKRDGIIYVAPAHEKPAPLPKEEKL